MKMPILSALLFKDLNKARRKPVAYIVNIAIPLLMTGMVGFIFSPSGDSSNALGVIKVAIVDEDQSIIGEFLADAVNNEDLREHFDLSFHERTVAMALLLDNEISAVLVLPEGFTDAYLDGENVPPIKLIKNPAQYYHPAIVEELMGVVVEGANAIQRVAGEDLKDWREIIEEEGVPDMTRIAGLMLRLGERFKEAGEFLFPPLVQYSTRDAEAGQDEESEGPAFNLFALVLPGFVGLFMFFLADNVVRDIFREEKAKTLERFRYFQQSLVPFMISKGAISLLVVMISMLATIGFGILLFGIPMDNLLPVILFVAVYSFFVTGFILFMNAIAGTERRADTLNPILIFGLAFLGGNMIPADTLPAFITDHISWLLPNYWFVLGMQHIQFGWHDVSIAGYSIMMVALGLLFLYVGSRILYSKLERRRL